MTGYRAHIEWIAYNDDTNIGNDETGFIISVCMTADLYQKEQRVVAASVRACRKKTEFLMNATDAI